MNHHWLWQLDCSCKRIAGYILAKGMCKNHPHRLRFRRSWKLPNPCIQRFQVRRKSRRHHYRSSIHRHSRRIPLRNHTDSRLKWSLLGHKNKPFRPYNRHMKCIRMIRQMNLRMHHSYMHSGKYNLRTSTNRYRK